MLNYIDLFCGIGGFHQGIERVAKEKGFQSKCLFAADIDLFASSIYKKNYGIDANYDLQKEETHLLIDSIIKSENNGLDFIFGGFPCQAFSKAGNQEGFENKTKGTLFFEIIKIIEKHRPKYILLENVRNLKSHDSKTTWNIIYNALVEQGYNVDYIIMSPNQIETKRIPALRDRIFIMCYRNDINIDKSELFNGCKKERVKTSIFSQYGGRKMLKKDYFKNDYHHELENSRIKTLDMWDDFRNRILRNGGKMISPVWPHYFDDFDVSEIPLWKQKIVKRNREFYKENKNVIDKWMSDYSDHFKSLIASDRKFEWNAGADMRSIYDGIIQFRPSGVRVKRGDTIPTLVAINQTPILGFQKRYMTPDEMKSLYGFKKLKLGEQLEEISYKQLGNTVSVDVVEYLINHMLYNVCNGGRENE